MPAWAFGAAVHVFTAFGAVCGLLALQSTAEGNWRLAFLWLGIALVIDGVDGPLARRFDAAGALPRFSGIRLDLVVDYLNYCAVPAFIVVRAELVPAGLQLVAGSIIMLSSLFHFADRRSKTDDGYFIGFPAVWNLVCFYILALGIGGPWTFVLIVVLAIATFAPLKWLHPLRVRSLRPVTMLILIAWTAAALLVVATGFPAMPAAQAVLLISAAYALAVGVSQTANSRRSRGDAD